jgi:prepilin peptidase CpaA
MDFALVSLVVAAAAAITASSMLYDLIYYRLPNYLMLALLLLYPAYVLASPVDIPWGWDLVVALIVLVIGVAVYALGAIGAGDVKFAAIAFLWAGAANGLAYFIVFAIIGGVLSVMLLLGRPILAKFTQQDKLIRVWQLRAPVPYGLALGSALLLLWFGAY